jgi:hypothetical protein
LRVAGREQAGVDDPGVDEPDDLVVAQLVEVRERAVLLGSPARSGTKWMWVVICMPPRSSGFRFVPKCRVLRR